MSIDNPGTPGTPSSEAEQRAERELGEAGERVKSDIDAVAERASQDAQALKREAESQIEEAGEKAKSFAADQKDFAAGQITRVASAIAKVADELDGEQPTTARYARDLAGGLDRFGHSVEGKSVDELMGMAQQFGRSQPLAFLGAAALAGFVASRFAGASAQRLHRQDRSAGMTGTTRPNDGHDRDGDGAQSGSSYGQPGSSNWGGSNVTG